ncbi:hypothetical protein [Methanobrevibacter sp.]|uniref:hypothetical protein n=1 Tax=Methanobrevibacter sp. TaxID=66852 RepID=UPI003866FB37
MNIQDRILQLNYELTGNSVEIRELLFIIITKYQLYEPCAYMSEDENWLNIAIISSEGKEATQAMSILKKDITAFGLVPKRNAEVPEPQVESTEDLYQ